MNSSTRRLVILRHAKSAWPFGVTDRERPLAPRGQRDAPRMGRWIDRFVGPVDIVVLSPVARTEQTWLLLSDHVRDAGLVRRDPRIYDAWGSHLLSVVHDLPENALNVLLIGHEPGVSELALTLANSGNPSLRRRIGKKFPTCGAAVLRSDRPWSQFAPSCAALERFVTPKADL